MQQEYIKNLKIVPSIKKYKYLTHLLYIKTYKYFCF